MPKKHWPERSKMNQIIFSSTHLKKHRYFYIGAYACFITKLGILHQRLSPDKKLIRFFANYFRSPQSAAPYIQTTLTIAI